MKKILAIGGSNSNNSINKVLANHIATQVENTSVVLVDWNNLVLPLYSPNLEQE